MKRPERQSIPLADLGALIDPARRTAVGRWLLAGGLVAVLVVAAILAQRPASSEITLVQGGRSGMVVLDMSASIGSGSRRIVEPFEYLADTGQEFGLVLFSGMAYEAAPPGTSGTELRAFLRAYSPLGSICVAPERSPCPPRTRRVEPNSPEAQQLFREAETPWTDTFRGGTTISAGLKLAREALERHGMTDRGVLLISDLDDSLLDIPALTRELITYRRAHIPIHLVALAPFDEDRFFFERMVGREAFVDRADLVPGKLLGERQRAERAGVPEGLAALALFLLMLLAVNEHFCARLAWRAER
ncbi:MAG: hypothetical protein ACRDM9_05030 [Gaiellaceae bacterium]